MSPVKEYVRNRRILASPSVDSLEWTIVLRVCITHNNLLVELDALAGESSTVRECRSPQRATAFYTEKIFLLNGTQRRGNAHTYESTIYSYTKVLSNIVSMYFTGLSKDFYCGKFDIKNHCMLRWPCKRSYHNDCAKSAACLFAQQDTPPPGDKQPILTFEY